jgi:hypothetical protein
VVAVEVKGVRGGVISEYLSADLTALIESLESFGLVFLGRNGAIAREDCLLYRVRCES